jgi:hypothetical protein
MAKDKYAFIEDLLQHKKLTIEQREQVLKLSAKEIKEDKKLEQRISRLEGFVGITTPSIETNSEIKDFSQNTQNDIPQDAILQLDKYFDPAALHLFLLQYNQHPILRTTCHDIDTDSIESINEY